VRARQRRNAIIREAQRLGVMVPGLPGYVPFRDRQNLIWTRSDGSENPDLWEVAPKGKAGEGKEEVLPNGQVGGGGMHIIDIEDESDLQPVSIIPTLSAAARSSTPIPASSLSYFPNHLAYRPASLLPPPSRFNPDEPETLNLLNGEEVDVVAIIRMPVISRATEGRERNDDEEQVTRQWGGVELGIARIDVVGK